MNRATWLTGLAALALTVPMAMQANAKPAFARKEKKTCGYCHVSPKGGGARGFRGIYYASKKLSFNGFVEAKQAALAGVKPNSMGGATKPTKPYRPKK